ncbi:hypothetical protein [Desulfatibacillum aliphaticivorans]|uniref:hypothetical protein n=1 Tax=Desulfatibacillum aliphaticivorans TaxID=218208 RepID=UPI0012FBE783|nr:hypothetical protein [Desulfatibacillum aliphaticivorans]
MMKNKTPPENPSYVKLRREGIPIYQKADMNSQLLGQTPEGLFQVRFSYMVQGLKDDKFYVRVAHFENGLFVHGFILLSDTEVSLPQGNDPVS